MDERLLVHHCAPTLAGIKTGCLFSPPCEDIACLRRHVQALSRRLSGSGVAVRLLPGVGGRALVYVYRPAWLGRDLEGEQARQVLRRCGYQCTSVGECIGELCRRLAGTEGFPHEIGLFLGYPPGDVIGFIEHAGRCHRSCGYWKVYTDVPAAERTFARLRRCTELYDRRYARHRSLEQLVVAA